jgi:hypothetical protein
VGNSQSMRRGRALSFAALAVLLPWTSACGGGKPAPSPTPTVAAPPATAGAAAPSETPSPPTSPWGPVVKTTTLTITGKGGYKANVTLRWHRFTKIELSSLYPDCLDIVHTNNGGPTATPDLAVGAAVVEGTVTYPDVNGFTWPDTLGFSADVEADQDYACTGRAASGPAELLRVSLPSEGPDFSFMFAQAVPRTPDDPQGKFDESHFGDYQVTLNGVVSITDCTAGAGGDSRTCSVAYDD